MELSQDSFTINCIEDVKEAISKIVKDNPKKYLYKDIKDIINSFVFEINNQEQETQCIDLFHRLMESL